MDMEHRQGWEQSRPWNRWTLVTFVYVLLLSYYTRALKSQKNRSQKSRLPLWNMEHKGAGSNPMRRLLPFSLQSRDNCYCLINVPILCLVEFNHCNCERMYMIGFYCNFTSENIMRKRVIFKKTDQCQTQPKQTLSSCEKNILNPVFVTLIYFKL